MALFGRNKIDAVVVGVRYTSENLIEWIRAYEARGKTWSDWKLIRREDLIANLKEGKRYLQGERIPYEAGTFNTWEALVLHQENGKEYISIGSASQGRDNLTGVPIV